MSRIKACSQEKGCDLGICQARTKFPGMLVRASGNQQFLGFCQALSLHICHYQIESLYLLEIWLRAIAEHSRITDRIKAEEEKPAEEAILGHLERSERDI